MHRHRDFASALPRGARENDGTPECRAAGRIARFLAAVPAGIVVIACGSAAPTPDHAAQPAATAPSGLTRAAPGAEPGAPAPGTPPTENAPPPTRRARVTDTYHGVVVSDDYRWLEDGANGEVKAWSAAQNGHARSVLDAIPNHNAVRARLSDVLRGEGPRYPELVAAGKRWFVLVDAPPRQQKYVAVVDEGQDPGSARALVDPNALDPSGKPAVVWFRPSPDGSLLAISLSKAGSELGDVSVVDVATGKPLMDVVPRVNGGTAGGDLEWSPEGKGFYYTRYPSPGERSAESLAFFQQIYFHQLGQQAALDRYEFGSDFPRIAEIRLAVDPRTSRVLATVQRGDGGEFSRFLRAPSGKWKKLTDFGDRVDAITFDPTMSDLWAISRKRSLRGELLRVSGARLDAATATVVVPERPEALQSNFWGEGTFLATPKRVYTLYQHGGPLDLLAFSRAGVLFPLHAPLETASFEGLARSGSSVLLRGETWLTPPTWYRLDEKTGESEPTPFRSQTKLETSGYGVLRETARSKDGTEVPFNVITPKDFHADSTRACVVTGYGGYGNSVEPRFRPDTALWLERGVVHVVANLRGGGEFGEAWHLAGNLLQKQNVFDDFAAVITTLAEHNICDKTRVGIIGGSNGGLLMGATLVQHPELVRAVVSFVGIYDSLREELSPNGAFNVTEFGTVKDEAQFKALYAYAPYHHVTRGVHYPATLFITGENDPRVNPMQSRKMTAMLQASTGGKAPILLRTSSAAGHGGSTDLAEAIAQKADAFSFMLDALGVKAD